MPPVVKVTRTRAGGGGGKARHNTRRTELERLAERVIRRVAGAVGLEGLTGADGRAEDGPCFWTRNLPGWALEQDAVSDALAAHAYGWDSDVALAEARLEREAARGNLEARDGLPLAIRSAS